MTYCLVPPFSSAILSSKLTFTSYPTPNTKILDSFLFNFATFLSIWSVSVVPTVASPSVRNTTIRGRLESGFSVSGANSASLIFVPPFPSMSSMKAIAFSRSFLMGTNSFENDSTFVLNKIKLKRSPSFRLLTQKRSASLACSIFLPFILPERSSIKMKSFSIISFLSTLYLGEISSMKNPASSRLSRCVIRSIPNSLSERE